ncbi:phosphotransferase enzyme family protein [Aspergillus taichungensis]|uniref:Phosphotransferase enzyme family protein n=1 Tax=Aspergillus taichungensis TaxID=482145 RepID=A0A2J5I7L3_9EURO|nr:phosphotransferase enzyme family protein [Aspergillus taichungensis]
MTCEGEHIQLTPSKVPSSPNFVVQDSSFFQKWDQLPSPSEVQARAKAQHLAGVHPDPRRVYLTPPYVRPPPVVFEEMGLFVKWGSSVEIFEAQCLYAIRRFLEGDVPVPEVYGWRTDGDVKYVYMEYVKGTPLDQVWSTMRHADKVGICSELRTIFQRLRQIEQDPEDPFIGSITRGPLYDRVFNVSYMHEAGPFTTVRDFHDWFTFLCRRWMPDPYSVPVEPFRHDLPDDCAIKFTHGDLHPSNIIVTSDPPYRTLAIIDWEQSGLLPEYWESCKAQYVYFGAEDWSTTYLPMILDQFASTWDSWDYYTMSMGC